MAKQSHSAGRRGVAKPAGARRHERLLETLTRRELEVLALLAAGQPVSEIARRLGIGRETVKRHLTHIYRKLGVGNRIEAVRVYLLAGR